ncbi:MAG: dehydrogenase [Bdellovibrionaceae bacterium]|nr:dehydrogenase [Pseudobdellovibrionaceae bacterium]
MKNSFRIAEISFGYSHWDYVSHFEYDSCKFEVQRFGANFSVTAMKALIKTLNNEVDAFALSSLPPSLCLRNKSFIHRQYFEIMDTPSSVPLCDGTGLKEIITMETMMELIRKKEINPRSGFYLPIAFMNSDIEEYLRHIEGSRLFFGDLYAITGLPLIIRPFLGLMQVAQTSLNFATMKSMKGQSVAFESEFQEKGKQFIVNQLKACNYVIGDLPVIDYFHRDTDIFKDKELITWTKHEVLEQKINTYGFSRVHQLMPSKYNFTPNLNFSLLEAILRLKHQKASSQSFEEWQSLLGTSNEVMHEVRKYGLKRNLSTQVKLTKKYHKLKDSVLNDKAPDFAFVVHALSHKDFQRIPMIGNLVKQLPKKWNDDFDKHVAKLPPIVYGRINKIVSDYNGREVNGIIYALLATPKVLKNSEPEQIYNQIHKCCVDAAERGAKIIGLGAYTKVVGDSGVTINKNSPLPVTTGNSLSASATLWALYEVVLKMKLLNLNHNTGLVQGIAMVIGATGSIGKVSAKLLSLVFEKVVIVAPRKERLEQLKLELEMLNPKCEILISTDANHFASISDVLVTATSSFDQKIVDVMQLKPGCVVCDCSRPLDFTKEEARKRPDVLIIESGELILPGSYNLTCDIGLPKNIVYACLAETAVLSMEEKYESFTLGRDIDWMKVKEIYKLSQKHGVKLANIYGHLGDISEKEIMLTRELALARRKRT